METLGNQLAGSALQITITVGILAFLGRWMFGAQIKSIVSSAVSAEQYITMKAEIQSLKTDVEKLKSDMLEFKDNYIARFEDAKLHTTSEVNRIIESMEKDRKIVTQLQINCAANHGVGQ